MFCPQSVAVIGASDKPGSIGRSLMENLDPNLFGGTVYPVNPNRAKVLGRKVYPRIGAIPGPVDLAVVVTPAATVITTVEGRTCPAISSRTVGMTCGLTARTTPSTR
jgi:acetyltransferase